MQKVRIQQNFNRASKTYDRVSTIQKICAQQLVILLQQHFPDFYPTSILDIGTGTGHIPAALFNIFPTSQYLLNDLSEGMLSMAHIKLGNQPNISLLPGDMEHVQFGHQELIISNFALQWAAQLTRILHQLYERSNLLVFSCLLEGTFTEWTALFTHYALPLPTYAYPTEQALTTYLLSLQARHCYIKTQDFMLTFDSLLHFIKYLQQLGANTGQHFLTPSQLKTLLKHSTHSFTTTYKVYFALVGDP
jgi:malonyl-CoA O-methyltransferase